MAFTPATAREDPKLSRPSLSELGSLEWQRGRLMWSVTLAWISRQAMFIGRAMLRSSLLVE